MDEEIVWTQTASTVDISRLRKQLEKVRLKYKPEIVKYLLIAEAAPDSIDHFSITKTSNNTTIYF